MAPDGTLVVILVEVLAVTKADVPLNLTRLLAGLILKLTPVKVTIVPTVPLPGLKEVICGAVAVGSV